MCFVNSALLSARKDDLSAGVVNKAFDALQSHVIVSICDSLFCNIALEVRCRPSTAIVLYSSQE